MFTNVFSFAIVNIIFIFFRFFVTYHWDTVKGVVDLRNISITLVGFFVSFNGIQSGAMGIKP
jgi:hypothetical protein